MAALRRVHIGRVREILTVFYDVGFGLLIRRLQLDKHLPLHLRLLGRFRIPKGAGPTIETLYAEEVEQLPERLRLGLERLGPTFVKFGQILSLRADLVGSDIANELRRLQDHVPALPFSKMEAVLKAELKQPLSLAFKKLNARCIGSASLAQVYRGTLRGGEDVAVKILRPGIEKGVKEDILILQWIAHLLEQKIPAAKTFRPARMVAEFAEWTARELNLLNEATQMAHFRALFGEEDPFAIPNVFWKYTTSRVLTMSFSHGVRPDDHAALKKMKLSRRALASAGIRLAFRQFFEFGIFHGDPHPGNFFVLKNGSLCLHDFGIVGRISDATRRELIGCFLGFLDKDADAALKHLLHIADVSQAAETSRFIAESKILLERWFYAPSSGRRLSQTFYEIVISGARYGVVFPTEIVLLAKAIITMDSMALDLDPKFDVVNEIRPYLQKALAIELDPSRLARRARDAALDTNILLDEIPEATRSVIKLAKNERLVIRLNPDEVSAVTKEIDRQTDIRLLSLLFVAVLLASTVFLYMQGVTKIAGISFASIGLIIAVALGGVVVWKIRQGARS